MSEMEKLLFTLLIAFSLYLKLNESYGTAIGVKTKKTVSEGNDLL